MELGSLLIRRLGLIQWSRHYGGGLNGVMGRSFDKVMVPLLDFFTPFEIRFSDKN